ncbi:17782_t:CDS:1, partial [Gigaspora rosea]
PIRRPMKHMAQFKSSRAITVNAESYLQSVEVTIEAVPPRSNPFSQKKGNYSAVRPGAFQRDHPDQQIGLRLFDTWAPK